MQGTDALLACGRLDMDVAAGRCTKLSTGHPLSSNYASRNLLASVAASRSQEENAAPRTSSDSPSLPEAVLARKLERHVAPGI